MKNPYYVPTYTLMLFNKLGNSGEHAMQHVSLLHSCLPLAKRKIYKLAKNANGGFKMAKVIQNRLAGRDFSPDTGEGHTSPGPRLHFDLSATCSIRDAQRRTLHRSKAPKENLRFVSPSILKFDPAFDRILLLVVIFVIKIPRY